MTSQVAVVNLNGIAVASDTLLTITSGESTKVIGGKSKIYTPGSPHKFVILHSGSNHISGVPIHLHLHSWFQSLAHPLPTLSSYVDSYRAWTLSENRLVSQESEERLMREMVAGNLQVLQEEIWRQQFQFSAPELTERKIQTAKKKLASAEIESYFSSLSEQPLYPGISDNHAKKLLQNLKLSTEDDILPYLYGIELTQDSVDEIVGNLHLVLSRVLEFPGDAELVFAGFGENEAFAHWTSIITRGVYGGSLQASINHVGAVDPLENIPSNVIPLAQANSIFGFFRGQDKLMRRKYSLLVEDKIHSKWGDSSGEKIGQDIAREIDEEIGDYSDEEFVFPFLRNISVLNPISMGELAEFLVGLQAMTSYKEVGPATVGGFIEVATIDLIDGVVFRKSLP